MISCILDNIDELYKSDISIGTTILGLLPSIIAIAAAQPEEIVKLALVSPLRGVATAAFSVGISPTVFTRLKPMRAGSARDEEMVWEIQLARVARERSWLHVAAKIGADVLILLCTGIMLWQNWVVNSAVLVQWLCESPVLVFTWPLISMVWVPIAVALLYAMAENVSFKHATRDDVEYSWLQVFLMPYTLHVDCLYHWDISFQSLSPSGPGLVKCIAWPGVGLELRALSTPSSRDTCSIRIVAKMPDNSEIFCWRNYFFVIEILAIAIYFYATFVLLSVLFISSVGSVRFAALMAGLYTAVRLLEGLC